MTSHKCVKLLFHKTKNGAMGKANNCIEHKERRKIIK